MSLPHPLLETNGCISLFVDLRCYVQIWFRKSKFSTAQCSAVVQNSSVVQPGCGWEASTGHTMRDVSADRVLFRSKCKHKISYEARGSPWPGPCNTKNIFQFKVYWQNLGLATENRLLSNCVLWIELQVVVTRVVSIETKLVVTSVVSIELQVEVVFSVRNASCAGKRLESRRGH